MPRETLFCRNEIYLVLPILIALYGHSIRKYPGSLLHCCHPKGTPSEEPGQWHTERMTVGISTFTPSLLPQKEKQIVFHTLSRQRQSVRIVRVPLCRWEERKRTTKNSTFLESVQGLILLQHTVSTPLREMAAGWQRLRKMKWYSLEN